MMQEAAKLAELPACQPIIEFLSQKYHHPDIKTPGFDEKIQAQISETEGRFSEAIALYKKVLASKSNFNAETINKKINWLEPLTKKFEPSTSQLEKYCGEYGPLKVTKSGNALQFETPGGRYDLIPMGENWFAPKNDLTFRLEFDNNNQLKSHFYDGRIFSDKKLPAPREELHMGASYRSSTAFLMMRHNLTPTASIPAPDYPLGAQNNQSTTHAISSPGNSSTSATIEITNQQAEDQQKTAPSVKSPFKNLSETPKLTRE